MARWYEKTSDLGVGNRTCACCGRELSAIAVMLEHDQRDDTYHDRGDVPADKSQGWFPFGLKCARKAPIPLKDCTP